MADEVIKRLLVEIDGDVEKLRQAIRRGETDLKGFANSNALLAKAMEIDAARAARTQEEALKRVAEERERSVAAAEAGSRRIAAAEREAYREAERMEAVQRRVAAAHVESARQAERSAVASRISFRLTGTAADAISSKQAVAARAVASATETIARQGKVSGEALKQIIAQGTNAAFFFGPKGALVGAVGISLLAIAGLAKRARDEFRELEEEVSERIKRLVDAGDMEGLKGRARDLYVGTPSERFQDGISARSARIRELELERRALEQRGALWAALDVQGKIDAERAALKPLTDEYERLKKALDEFQRPTTSGTAAPFMITAQGPGEPESPPAIAAANDEHQRMLDQLAEDYEAFRRRLHDLVLRELGTEVERVAAEWDKELERALEVGANSVELAILTDLKARAVEMAEAAEALKAAGTDDDGEPIIDPVAARDYARELHQAADGALQLAQNLGGADASLISMLRSIGQIAGNLPTLAKAITSIRTVSDSDVANANVTSNWSAGNVLSLVGAALPIIGALSSMIGTSPAEEARRELLAKNNEALEALTARLGQLGLGISGSAAGGAVSGLTAFLGSPEARAGGMVGQARRAAQAFGLNLTELDEIAKAHGITLDGSIESFRQLQEALGLTITKLGEFDTTLDSQRAQADAEITLRGITDPAERARIRRRAYAGRSSALDQVTSGLDLDTAEGREEARRRALALFETMKAGGGALDAGSLGSLTGDQLLQALLDLIAGLEDVEGAIAGEGSSTGTVSGFRGLTEASGNRLEDRLRALDLKAGEAQRTRLAMLDALMRLAGTPLPVPSIDGGTFARAGTSVVVHVHLTQHLTIGAGGDASAFEAAAAHGLRGAGEDLYQAVRRAMRIAGDVRSAP